MKVLLLSPKDPKIPGKLKFLTGGENTYTQSLLSKPPKGVNYTHWQDALKKGEIEHTLWRWPLNMLMKARILPVNPGILCFSLNKNFDLIHCHAYNLKLDGMIKPPVILSDSSSNTLFLKDYIGWGEFRINISYLLKKVLVEMLGIYDLELNLKEAPLIVWSKFAKKVHTDLGQNPKRITVISPGLSFIKHSKPYREAASSAYTLKPKTFQILFIGVWFKRKGGDVLLKAFNKLKKRYSKIKLSLIGQVPKEINLPEAIYHENFVKREKLVQKIMPSADVLVLVPPKAEGYGLVVHEAASQGIPSIVSSVYALPELVKSGETGYVIKPGSAGALYKALEKLIKNPSARKKMGRGAKKQFEDKFWIEKTNKKLLKAYKKAVSR